MLVLSRRNDESIVFPNVGITVKILRVDRRSARIGIEAPAEVRILRQEVGDESLDVRLDPALLLGNSNVSSKELHEIRNRLNTVNLGLHLYRQQMGAGKIEDANLTFLQALDDLERIDREVGTTDEVVGIPETPSQAAIRLLLVEDDQRQRDLLAGFLTLRGCEVATATDGEDALEYLANHEWPEFMLLDMRMPRCNGAQTVRQIREANASSNLKIFAISGSSPEEFGIETGPQGIDQWFPKPLNPDGLIEQMIESALPGSKLTSLA